MSVDRAHKRVFGSDFAYVSKKQELMISACFTSRCEHHYDEENVCTTIETLKTSLKVTILTSYELYISST